MTAKPRFPAFALWHAVIVLALTITRTAWAADPLPSDVATRIASGNGERLLGATESR
jgi:hypothetical protein